MRAASLIEDLGKAGIGATQSQAKWTNKRLPPPRIEIRVAEADAEAAAKVLAVFNAPKCGRCGSPKPAGQSCDCFDNACQ
jgi:hypothetical protein